MKWLTQTLGILLLATLCAVALYLCAGVPDRSFTCVQSELEEHHVCLETVARDWQSDVLWVDARSQSEFEKDHLAGALWISESDAEEQLASPSNMEQIGMSGVNQQKLVVYCATDACGSSEVVAEKIRETGFHSEVYVLQGGWKALQAAKLKAAE